MFQSKEIATLKASLAEAQTALETNAAALIDAQAELASAAALNASLTASAETTAAALAAAEAATIAAEARAAAAEAAVETQVIERLASAGVDPIKRDPKAKEGATSITREEFNKLTPAAQSEFCRNGGSIS